MKIQITRAILDPFKIKLTSPITIHNEVMSERTGYYLKLLDDNDIAYVGELSPLTGLHNEKLMAAKDEIVKLLPALMSSPIVTKKVDLEKPFGGIFVADALPSVKFAIESALLDLIYKADVSLLNLEDNFSIPINSLFIPGGDKLKRNRCLKIKIGRTHINEDIKLINSVTRPGVKIRLDCNRNLDPDSLGHLLDNIDHSKIEYLEEPLKDLEHWSPIFEKYNIPLALDESLLQFSGKYPKGTSTLVIKPSVVGGIAKTLELMETAKDSGKQVVISSAFESSVGMKTNMLLAQMQNNITPTYHGLDTLRYLEEEGPLVEIQQKNNKLYLA